MIYPFTIAESAIPMQNARFRNLTFPFVIAALLILAGVFVASQIALPIKSDAMDAPASTYCTQVLPLIKDAGAACSKLDRDQICYGSRTVDVEFMDGTSTVSFL